MILLYAIAAAVVMGLGALDELGIIPTWLGLTLTFTIIHTVFEVWG